MSDLKNQTMALAGMFQCAALIEQMATNGDMNQAAFDCSFDSLFTFDAETTLDVFGDLAGLSRGLNELSQHLGGEGQPTSRHIAYYVLSMFKIAARLRGDEAMAGEILASLQKVDSQAHDFELSRRSIIAKIDGVYQNTVSKIEPRIMVRGEQNYLSNGDNASKIRTLLLAGIRAAVLWSQLGGSKWKLLFSRKKYLLTANQLLNAL
ncbi:MAG: high frequency lysogenization protein HflD [Gammaproteobacteria bacterium]